MKKLASKSGLTLIEMLVTILILVFLVLGIGTCMDSALNIYDEAKFESNSASMANIVNTSLADILRYSDISPIRPKLSADISPIRQGQRSPMWISFSQTMNMLSEMRTLRFRMTAF